ncbi:hypothetical protein FHS29_007094 [Saccharothrix tamanrassetensis]|uniref:DUF3137 domain-containing protein n=1 Tax=Saccharothrix tamanrassetensis TaxID=1051531 RepID=A0A841CT76_9PSEU|nr:hypothetical protein [Saccharothrix tamanrassetensis]MBB5960470.1 hypothetical protein [Saccharothrix tamanrassetensis]
MPADLDYSPLTAPVDPAAALAHAKANGDRPTRDLACCAFLLALISAAFFGFLSVPLNMYLAGTYPDGGVGVRLLGLLPLAIGLGLVVLVVVLSRKSGRQERIDHYRIMQFAARNGMGYRMKVKDPEHPAGVFDIGVNRCAVDVVSIEAPRPMEIGQYSYTAGYHNAETFHWGYATVPLDANLPHLRLNSRAKGMGTVHESGKVTLGHPDLRGPGTKAFSVSGPFGRAREIQTLLDRTLFSSDLLARYAERPVHIEVVENRLYFFSPKPLSTTDPDTWRWLLTLLADTAERLES